MDVSAITWCPPDTSQKRKSVSLRDTPSFQLKTQNSQRYAAVTVAFRAMKVSRLPAERSTEIVQPR